MKKILFIAIIAISVCTGCTHKELIKTELPSVTVIVGWDGFDKNGNVIPSDMSSTTVTD